MANTEQVIYVDLNTNGIQSASKELDKELLVLRLALGKLRAAILNAAAPIGAVFIPIVQKAVWAATRLVKTAGRVISALFRQSSAAKNAAKAQTVLAKANDQVKRSLADFDELDRLDSTDSGALELPAVGETDSLSPQLQAVVDKIMSLVLPLQNIDFAPAVAAFGRLKEAIAPITQSLFAGLEWAWHNLLVPLAAWTVEDLLPVFLTTLASALGVLNAVIVALQPAATWLWETFLQPIAQWTGETILEALGWLRQRLDGISHWVSENSDLVQKIALAAAAMAIANGILGNFNGLSGRATGLMGGFGNAMGLLTNPISLITGGIKLLGAAILLLIGNWDGVKHAATGAWGAICSAWSGAAAWFQSAVLMPMTNGFQNMANGIIGFLNGLVAGAVSAVNGIVRAVNRLQFTVPDWVPGLGGQTLGFQLKELSTPQIPYLAQGAVLPANKPFLAVVGDQKHGTNVEAPLDVIKQALSEVLGSQGETVVQVNFNGDLAQLARVLKPAIDTETRRIGGSLAKGAVI